MRGTIPTPHPILPHDLPYNLVTVYGVILEDNWQMAKYGIVLYDTILHLFTAIGFPADGSGR